MELKVISFNIRCCDDKNGNSIPERAPRLDKVTACFDADVIGFQEYRPAWGEHIEKYYGDKYDMFLKFRTEDPSDLEAAPILWKKDKFECIKTGYFWLSDTPEIESRGWDEVYNCYRICVYAILKEKESGEYFTFMNTHFGFGDKGQIASAGLIYEYSKKISDYPTFIVGDFNMTPSSAGYAEMIKNFTDVNAVTVNDRRSTYHGYDLTVKRDSHIDFCFIDESITPVSLKLIDETVEGKFPSDHFGLYTELKF